MQRRILRLRSDAGRQRDRMIDFLRGAAMILVLLHHSNVPNGQYILAFHMPLFFVISGYLGSQTGGYDKPFGKYVLRKFIRIMVPYFAFEAANLLIWFIKCSVENASFSLGKSVFSIITCINDYSPGMYGGRLWFLPCIFFADIYVWLILKLFKNNKFANLLSAFALFGASFAVTKVLHVRLYFTLDTALFAAAFIMLGYISGGAIKILLGKGNNVCKILLMLGSAAYLVYAVRFTYVKDWMYVNEYGEYTVTICAAVSGCVAFLILFGYLYRLVCRLKIVSDFVIWYGENSLATFPVHLTIKMMVIWYIPVLSPWYFLFFVMLFLNIPIVNFITNFLPFMLGRKYSLFGKRPAQKKG